MNTYVAFLRGIMPMNPNMRGEKLREVFQSLGLKNVQTVIASGNVIFRSPTKNTAALESKIEDALFEQLGFKSTTIVRGKEELELLVEKNPFKNAIHSPENYLIVTFFKKPTENGVREMTATIDTTSGKGSDFMRTLEKQYGKDITTRTWKTVGRVVQKMQEVGTNL